MQLLKLLSVAIIDDCPITRKILTLLFRRSNLTIAFEAENGEDGIRKMSMMEVLPDVILLDIEMPVMNGYETAKQVRMKWPEVKIIAHSSVFDQADIRRIVNTGVDRFLTKGCTQAVLTATILEMFEDK